MVDISPVFTWEGEVSEGGGEVMEGVRHYTTFVNGEKKMSEGAWQVIHRLVEMFPKAQFSKRRRERIQRGIEI